MILIYPVNFFEFRNLYRGENHKQGFGKHSIQQKYIPLLSITIVNMPAILSV